MQVGFEKHGLEPELEKWVQKKKKKKLYWKTLVVIHDVVSFYDISLSIIIYDLDDDRWLSSLLQILYFLHQI